MIPLEEYLGKLVSSLSRARVLADMESARIAQFYATDNLLKHFSIPRMRLVDVELTIPVAICDLVMELKRKVRFIEKRRVADLTRAIVYKSLNVKSLPEDISKKFELEMNRHIDILMSQISADNYERQIHGYASEISKLATGIVKSTFPMDFSMKIDDEFITSNITSKINDALGKEITFEMGDNQLTSLNIIAETHKLKEISINNMVIIKMKVSEESMTWERIDDGSGNVINKLMSE